MMSPALPLRVLCLGAYGNGNIGDACQADALAALLHLADPRLEVYSLSLSKRAAPYPAHGHYPVPLWRARDLNYVNSFDLLLAGGGGLLASPHQPLFDEAWIQSLKVPLCAVSLGAGTPHVFTAAPFIRACRLFSVRDEFSRAAVRKVRDDVAVTLDPILLAPADTAVEKAGETAGIVWIPAKFDPQSRPTWEEIAKTGIDRGHDAVVSLNPATDRASGFAEVFGEAVLYADGADTLLAAMRSRRLVVSERYHGCIYAARWPKPCVGLALRRNADHIVTSKTLELFRLVPGLGGIADIATPPRRALFERIALDGFDGAALEPFLAGERTRLLAHLQACLAVVASESAMRMG